MVKDSTNFSTSCLGTKCLFAAAAVVKQMATIMTLTIHELRSETTEQGSQVSLLVLLYARWIDLHKPQ
jgi:hypothetical protein